MGSGQGERRGARDHGSAEETVKPVSLRSGYLAWPQIFLIYVLYDCNSRLNLNRLHPVFSVHRSWACDPKAIHMERSVLRDRLSIRTVYTLDQSQRAAS